MELVLEIFLTILLAAILSFLLVKLVSEAFSFSSDPALSKSSSDPISRNASNDIFKSGRERSTVLTSPPESKADDAISEPVGLLDRFQFQAQRENPVQVDSSVEIEHIVKDMTAEEAVQPHFPEVTATNDFGQQSEAIELPEKASGQTTEAEDAISLSDKKEECEVDDTVKQRSQDEPEAIELPEKALGQTTEADDAISLSDKKKECEVDDTVKQRSQDEPVSSLEEEVSAEPSSEDEMVVQSKEIFRVDEASDSKETVEQKKHVHDHDEEDDWEGIERTELEKVFAAATEFVDGDESKSMNERLFKIGSDVQMEMYGLHKIATEGPCREPQPMALKISARAKWNAWQQLGNMNPEEAMEKYISLLSDRVPEWMKETSMGHAELKSTEAKPEIENSACSDLGSSICHQPIITDERNLGLDAGEKQDDHVAASELDVQAKE